MLKVELHVELLWIHFITCVEKCVPRGGASGRSELSCDPLENRYGYNYVHVVMYMLIIHTVGLPKTCNYNSS